MNTVITSSPMAHQKNTTEYTLKSDTIIDALHLRLEHDNDFLIFMDMKNHEFKVTALDAYQKACLVAQELMQRGLQKNDKITIMIPTSPEFVYIYYGILMAGGSPVPVSQPAGTRQLEKYLDNLQHIVSDSESKFFITIDNMKMIIGGVKDGIKLDTEFLFTSELVDSKIKEEDFKEYPEINGQDIALVQYTSGTTGKPKGVLLSHENLLHNVHGIGVASAIDETDVGISWLPLYHDMGLIGGLFVTMYWNIPAIMMKPEAFLFKPQWWLQNMTKYGVTMTVSPNFGYHYCVTRIDEIILDTIDLSTLRLALNGAEPIDRLTLKKFIRKFTRCGLNDNIFFPVYGMAENSLAATFPSLEQTTVVMRFDRKKIEEDHIAVELDSDNTQDYIDLVSVGYPLVGQEIRIANDSDETLKERQIGQILVKSKSLTRGYYKKEEATKQTIKDGWLRTGDMGFILDGMLFISGRIKEIIIKRGKNIYPYDVERIASTVDGVRLGSAAAFAVENHKNGTEDIVLVCETRLKSKEDKERIKKQINSEVLSSLGVTLDDIRIVPKGTVPKTTSGKIQRILCKKLYLEDDLLKKHSRNIFIMVRSLIMSYFHLFGKKLSRS